VTEKLIQLRPWRRQAVRSRAGSTSILAWPAAIFLTIAGFMAFDLAADIQAGYPRWHIWIEVAALALSLTGVARTAGKLWRATHQTHHLRRVLAGTRADLARWREEAQGLLRGLGAAIDRQLQRWSLSAAEQEVAWLILRGLSYKDIADVRRTTERTVRHQAVAIFHKAGLAGRAEMAAFFLEDLLDAREERSDTEQPEPGLEHASSLDEDGAA
jgi:DNA-binding CsgD family transcriptional regulator